MRRSYAAKKLARHTRKPAELLLVPMIDIFTVLVTFLLMTAVFSKTVVLELNLPAAQSPSSRSRRPGCMIEVMVRKNLIQVADRNTRPARDAPQPRDGLRLRGPHRLSEAREGEIPREDRRDASCSRKIRPTTSWCR